MYAVVYIHLICNSIFNCFIILFFMSWVKIMLDIYSVHGIKLSKNYFSFSANEKRAFLLYYSIPLLVERLDETCFLHLAFLVGGIYRLLKDSISKTDLEGAGVLLKLYCAQAPYVYGEHTCTLFYLRYSLTCNPIISFLL